VGDQRHGYRKRNNQEVDPAAHVDAAKLSLTAKEVHCRDRGECSDEDSTRDRTSTHYQRQQNRDLMRVRHLSAAVATAIIPGFAGGRFSFEIVIARDG
jgi:hypothetical protein